MSQTSSKIRTYFQSDRAFKRLAFITYFLLGFGRTTVLIVPFKKIASWMGVSNQQTENTPLEQHLQYLDSLGKAIRAVSPYTPWKSNCFAQALCAHWLLKSRSISHTIYFGVKFSEGKTMEAHAWLRAGDKIVTGGAGHSDFKTVGTFACYTKSVKNPA